MSIGERIKAARRRTGLGQRELAQAAGVSAMAISKYERGLDTPGSAVLLRLAKALDVKTEYFVRPVTVTLITPAYRRRVALPRKQEGMVLGRVQEWLERYLAVESLYPKSPRFDLPARLNRRVTGPDEAERVALDLRREWNLGLDPVESLVAMLEDRGIKVGLVEGHEDWDALTFWMNDREPVIVVKRGLPGDRQRFDLAHELGHLVLEPANGADVEKAAYRFAGAFLAPEPVVRFELGEQRRTLDVYELHLLKHKYGLSMQGWIYRARDLGILSDSSAALMFRQFRQKGWRLQEPGDAILPEEPQRLERLVMRALAEDLISGSRAAELLGMPLPQFWSKVAEQHDLFPAGVRG